MKREKVEQLIKEAVKEQMHDVQVWLYGSEARGDARADSDVDVLLLVDRPLRFEEKTSLIAPLYDVELATGCSINPRIETVDSWSQRQSVFKGQVMRDRILVC